MSFNFGPMQNLSNVQASSKSTPGGGGNTGYFKRGKKEEEENSNLGFIKDYPDDSFENENNLEEIQEQSFIDIIKGLFLDFIEAIKNLFAKKDDNIEE